MNIAIQVIVTALILGAYFAGYIVGRKRKETEEQFEAETIERLENIADYLQPKDYSLDFVELRHEVERGNNRDMLQDIKEYISNEFDQFRPHKNDDETRRAFYE